MDSPFVAFGNEPGYKIRAYLRSIAKPPAYEFNCSINHNPSELTQ